MIENKVLKQCKKHGDLTFDKIFFAQSGYQFCLFCRNERPYIETIRMKNINKIVKLCKKHGELNIDQVYVSESGWQWCKLCKENLPPTIEQKNIINFHTELKCRICNIIKPIEEFFKNSRPGSLCKPCEKIRKSEYRKRPEVRAKEYKREISNHYKRRYGITLDQYYQMLSNQNGCCAICKKNNTKIDHRTKKIQKFHIDHCHDTKKVRGLLCNKCNQGLGYFKDNILLLEACIKYLQKNIKDL